MAMLGLIHRTALGKGPEQFKRFFKAAKEKTGHQRQLEEWTKGCKCCRQLGMLKHSALGLVAVYNKLPERVVAHNAVKDFQKALQEELKDRAGAGNTGWQAAFSPR